MHADALVVAPLLVAAVLLLSGLAKVLRPGDQDEAFESLGVPARLRHPAVVRLHPWAEILLGAGVLLLPHPASTVGTAPALGLLAAYLLLVARVVRRGEAVRCQCFGALGGDRVTGVTVVRNAVLVVLAGVAFGDALGGGSVPGRVADLSQGGWWWLGAAGVTALVVVLVTAAGTGTQAEEPLQEYLRLPVPDVPVRLPGGPEQSLRDLGEDRAQLLFFLSPGCGPCVTVASQLPSYAARLPELDVRVVSALEPEAVARDAPDWEPYLLLEDGAVSDVFGIRGRPVAVLLGRDGLLAGGPSQGATAIAGFIDEIEAELASVRPALDPAQD